MTCSQVSTAIPWDTMTVALSVFRSVTASSSDGIIIMPYDGICDICREYDSSVLRRFKLEAMSGDAVWMQRSAEWTASIMYPGT